MLEAAYKANNFELIFMPGERERERTEEIMSFINNKKTVFLSAIEFKTERNFDRLKKEIENIYNIDTKGKKTIECLEEISSKERVLLVIKNADKFITKDNTKAVTDFLERLKKCNVMMIILSNNFSFNNAFTTGEFAKYITNVNPLPFKTVFDSVYTDPYDKFAYYAVFNNSDKYIRHIDKSKSFKENIINTILNKDSIFIDEPKNILNNELRELQVYNEILEKIAKGAETLIEIAEKMNIPTSICNKYTTVLISLGIIEKVKPFLEEGTRKSKYRIKNSMLDFWYNFVPDNMNDIELHKAEYVYESKAKPQLDKFLSKNFKKVCTEYLMKQVQQKKIKIEIKKTGEWWDRRDTIDIVSGNGIEVLAADCFWDDKKVGKTELIELERKANKLDSVDKKYYLFSKAGFEKDIENISAKREDVKLISFKDMFDEGKETAKKRFFFSKH